MNCELSLTSDIDVYSGFLGGFSKGEIYKNQKWKFELCALLTDIFCTVVEHGDEAILNPYNTSASKQVVIWPTGMLHTVSVQKMEAPRHKVLAIVDNSKWSNIIHCSHFIHIHCKLSLPLHNGHNGCTLP